MKHIPLTFDIGKLPIVGAVGAVGRVDGVWLCRANDDGPSYLRRLIATLTHARDVIGADGALVRGGSLLGMEDYKGCLRCFWTAAPHPRHTSALQRAWQAQSEHDVEHVIVESARDERTRFPLREAGTSAPAVPSSNRGH